MIGIAKRAGVRTINVVRRSEQKDELLRLGCGAPASCPAAQASLQHPAAPHQLRHLLKGVGGPLLWPCVHAALGLCASWCTAWQSGVLA